MEGSEILQDKWAAQNDLVDAICEAIEQTWQVCVLCVCVTNSTGFVYVQRFFQRSHGHAHNDTTFDDNHA